MKIKSFALLFFLGFSSYAQNSLSLIWATDAPMLDQTSEPDSPVPINNSNDVLYFLFYTPDTSISIQPENGSFSWNSFVADERGSDLLVSVARDDFVLNDRELNLTQDWLGNLLTTEGYFYSLVVNYNDVSLDEGDSSTWDISIPEGTWAWVSEISPLVPFDDLSTPTQVLANNPGNWDGTGSAPTNSAVVDFVLIPEPGTLALIVMAVGGIAMKLRRRRS